MKNFKTFFLCCLAILFFATGFSQQANYVGHVTLLKRTATSINIGAGTSTPSSDAQNLGYGNPFSLNLGLSQSFWQKNNFGIGVHLFGDYLFGNGSPRTFAELPISGYTSTVFTSATPKMTGFSAGAGPQLNFGLGENFMISPIVDFAYVTNTLEGYSVTQNYQSSGTTGNVVLYSQPETKTSGLGIIPRLRMQYFFSKNIGIWLEGNYHIPPKNTATTSTFIPNGTTNQGGEYSIDQIMMGTVRNDEVSVNNSGIGFGGGIVIGIGKQTQGSSVGEKTKKVEKATSGLKDTLKANVREKKDKQNDTIQTENGEVFISKPVREEKKDRKNCIKIVSPSNGSNQNINENIKVLLSNEGLPNQKPDVKIYKISNDKNFWNKAENRREMQNTSNTVFLSSKFEKESQSTGFNPIAVDAKQSGAVLESNLERGKLSEGAYKMVVISNCGVTSSNFSVSSSALTTISLTTNCKEKFGDYSYTFVVKNTGTAPINVTSIPAFTSSTGTISGFSVSPTLPIVIPPGGTQNFTGSFSYSGTYTGDVYATVSGHQVGNVNLTSQDTEQGELKSCICDFCEKVLEFDNDQSPNATYTANNNSLSINQNWWNMNTSAGTVVGAKAEIISFERQISDDCMKCDKDSNQWGNFISGTSGTSNGSFGNATGSVTGNTHHTLYFANPNSYSFNLNISIPPVSTLTCCCEKIRFKIRYTYTFKDKNGECKMCSAVFEYFYQRGQCRKLPPHDWNPVDATGTAVNHNNQNIK